MGSGDRWDSLRLRLGRLRARFGAAEARAARLRGRPDRQSRASSCREDAAGGPGPEIPADGNRGRGGRLHRRYGGPHPRPGGFSRSIREPRGAGTLSGRSSLSLDGGGNKARQSQPGAGVRRVDRLSGRRRRLGAGSSRLPSLDSEGDRSRVRLRGRFAGAVAGRVASHRGLPPRHGSNLSLGRALSRIPKVLALRPRGLEGGDRRRRPSLGPNATAGSAIRVPRPGHRPFSPPSGRRSSGPESRRARACRVEL